MLLSLSDKQEVNGIHSYTMYWHTITMETLGGRDMITEVFTDDGDQVIVP